MTAKQWSAWLLAAGITTLLTVVSAGLENGGADTKTPSISLARMTAVQKDSVVRAELSRLNEGDEIVSLRETNVKITKGKQGSFAASIFIQPQHYLDTTDSVYKPIDLTVREISALKKLNPLRKFDRYVDSGVYRSTWFENTPWDYTFHFGDYFVTYTALFDTSETVHITTEPTNTGMKQSVVLEDSLSTATTGLRWLVRTNAAVAENGGELTFTDSGGRTLFRAPKPTAWDHTGNLPNINARLNGDTLSYDIAVPKVVNYPITIDPVTLISGVTPVTYGYYTTNAVYATARNATVYDGINTTMMGQYFSGGVYGVLRYHLHFPTASLPDWAVLDSASVSLGPITSDSDNTPFNIHLVESTASGTATSPDMFNDFPGWASSGTYSVTNLANVVASNTYSNGDTVNVQLNATGLAKISKTDSTRFFALSSRDINATTPTGLEYLYFGGAIYLRVYYHVPIKEPTNFRLDNPLPTSLRAQYTRNHSANVDSVGVVDNNGVFVKYFDTVTDTVTTITGLAPHTQYIFRCFVDSLGGKVYSNYDTLKTADAAPGDFTLTVLSPDSIYATWTDNADSEEWFVLLNTSDSTKVAGTDTLPPNTTGITVGNLTPNTVYEWFVRTRLATGDSTSSSDSDRTEIRLPGIPSLTALSPFSIRFIIAPVDNPSYTQFALQDSITGLYADGSAEPETLRTGPPGDWGWKTFTQWGGAAGDTLTGFFPDSLYVLRVKARTGE